MKGYGMLKVNQAGWIQREKPVAEPLDAIVRPTEVAPCSSDTHDLHGGGGDKKDLILGHEAVGEIVEVGNLVKKFKAGDKVVVPASTPNWLEKEIQGVGWGNGHDDGTPMGSFKFLSKKDGVWSEFFHVNLADANLVHLPEGVAADAALMTVDMMSTGFYGVELAGIEFGDKVAVLGIGPVGLMAVAGAKLQGAGQIIATGTRPNCIKVAKEYGVTDVVDYKKGDIVKQIHDLAHGKVDKVIIAGGNQDTLEQAIRMTKPGGVVANVNFFDAKDKFSIPATSWGLGMCNIDIRGGFCPGGAKRIEKLLEMVKHNRVDPTKLISHKFEGFEKIEDACTLMDKKPPEVIKPVVYINW